MNKSNYDYEEIIEHFGEDKIAARYDTIENYLNKFIARSKFKDNLEISFSLLNQAIIDYFADIDRLKNFHHIEKINYVKIHAYSAYWLLKRKPIQINSYTGDDSEITFINEDFVATYLLSFLRGEKLGVVIKKEHRQEYNEFMENIKYVLRYRLVTAQTLETILQSYNAGRIFERSIGISDEF